VIGDEVILKNLYVILINSETYFTKVIRLFTKNKYNHVVFALDNNCDKMYTFARWITWFPLFAGFEIENINRGVLKKKPKASCQIYEIEISEEEHFLLQSRLTPFLTKPRRKFWYNFAALLLIQLKLPYYSDTSFVCSTFVAYIVGDIINMNKHFIHVTPNDYLKLDMPMIYEGELKKYVNNNNELKIASLV